MNRKEINVFDVDIFRQELAETGQHKELLSTYYGKYPEIGNISTAEKWDSLSEMDKVPEIRIKRLEKVVNLIDADKKILDIGAGWGDIVPILHRYKQDVDYTGIDFSVELVKRLQDKYPAQKFINTTVASLSEKYDYVLVLEVLEHIVPSKVFDFLKEIKRVLKADGVLIVTVPLNENLKNSTFVCGKCSSFVNRMGHVRNYSLGLIKSELQMAGFLVKYTELIYEGYYGVKGLLKRYMRNVAGYLIGPSGFKPVMPACVVLKCLKTCA